MMTMSQDWGCQCFGLGFPSLGGNGPPWWTSLAPRLPREPEFFLPFAVAVYLLAQFGRQVLGHLPPTL